MKRTLFGLEKSGYKNDSPEQAIVNAICSWMSFQQDLFFWQQSNAATYSLKLKKFLKKTGWQRKGIPDIPGHMLMLGVPISFYMEVKTPEGTQSPDQKIFEADARARGGAYFVVRSVEDARMAIDSLRRVARARLLAAVAKEQALRDPPSPG